jgi:putative component of toxin-antitoxin plasmid stabilization module
MLEIRETSAYASWFAALRDRAAKVRIDIRIRRLSEVVWFSWTAPIVNL